MRGAAKWVLGALAASAVLAGLAVEAVTSLDAANARRAVPAALRQARHAAGTDADVAAALATAERHAASGRYAEGARALESSLAEAPTATLHDLAARSWLAASAGEAAARHAQLAARLAPEDAALQAAAEHALDLALAFRARGPARAAGALGGLVLLGLLGAGWHGRRTRRRCERYLDALTARVRFTVDGEDVTAAPVLQADSESLLVDVFLHGRYGMACPRRPARGLTLHVTCSHARANRTIRLTPVRDVRESAVRIPVRAETLGHLLDEEGRWLVHVRLGARSLVTATLDVEGRRARRAWPRRHALHA